jgi:hypothetical protein
MFTFRRKNECIRSDRFVKDRAFWKHHTALFTYLVPSVALEPQYYYLIVIRHSSVGFSLHLRDSSSLSSLACVRRNASRQESQSIALSPTASSLSHPGNVCLPRPHRTIVSTPQPPPHHTSSTDYLPTTNCDLPTAIICVKTVRLRDMLPMLLRLFPPARDE